MALFKPRNNTPGFDSSLALAWPDRLRDASRPFDWSRPISWSFEPLDDEAFPAVALARRGGATVLEASIFDRLPGTGTWNSALLLDGNIGIGGSPDALLRRLAGLLARGGAVLVELDPPGVGVLCGRVRLEDGDRASEWFAWAQVGADAVDGPAHAAGLHVRARWRDGERWFAELQAP